MKYYFLPNCRYFGLETFLFFLLFFKLRSIHCAHTARNLWSSDYHRVNCREVSFSLSIVCFNTICYTTLSFCFYIHYIYFMWLYLSDFPLFSHFIHFFFFYPLSVSNLLTIQFFFLSNYLHFILFFCPFD